MDPDSGRTPTQASRYNFRTKSSVHMDQHKDIKLEQHTELYLVIDELPKDFIELYLSFIQILYVT
jgi:hypothetical protein